MSSALGTDLHFSSPVFPRQHNNSAAHVCVTSLNEFAGVIDKIPSQSSLASRHTCASAVSSTRVYISQFALKSTWNHVNVKV